MSKERIIEVLNRHIRGIIFLGIILILAGAMFQPMVLFLAHGGILHISNLAPLVVVKYL